MQVVSVALILEPLAECLVGFMALVGARKGSGGGKVVGMISIANADTDSHDIKIWNGKAGARYWWKNARHRFGR